MEAETYALVKKSIKTLLEIDLTYYKDEQMKRRLDSWLTRSGASTWTDYFKRVREDEKERSRLRDYLTINVSAFFRDPERWQALRQTVLPGLLKQNRRLHVWSAGCSIGPEPYTLAMLFDDLTPGTRHELLATDLDRGALAKAKARGPYTADDTQNITTAQRAHFFDAGGPPYFVTESLAKRVNFRELNLLTDVFETNFDLIVCRNVVIYFTDEAKQKLYRKFFEALRPGGILFVGGTEVVAHSQDIGFRSAGISFYQRPA